MRISRFAACFAALAILVVQHHRDNAAGALATGKCGAFGYAFDDVSPEAAALRAHAQCKGKDCKVVTSFRRTCAAFAIDATQCLRAARLGAGRERSRSAQNIASEQCHRFGGRNCVIRAWVCDQKG